MIYINDIIIRTIQLLGKLKEVESIKREWKRFVMRKDIGYYKDNMKSSRLVYTLWLDYVSISRCDKIKDI